MINVVALHRHQDGAAGRAGRYDDDGAVAQGDAHVGQGGRPEGGGVGHALAAFKHDRVGAKGQGGGDGRHRLGLQIRRQIGGGEAVVVGQRIHAFGDAQQLHKAGATVGTGATAAQTGGRGFKCLTQVGPAFQCLNDGVDRGRCGNGAVLRGGALVGLGHVFVQPHALSRRDGQQAAIFHQEFDPGIAHGAHGFTSLQAVTDLELAAIALGINRENATISCDGSDGSKLGHDDLR